MKNIKHFILIISVLFLVIGLSACNGSDVTRLEEAINGLQSDKESLEEQMFLLNEALLEVEKDKKNQDSIISALRDQLNAAKEELEELNKQIEGLGGGIVVQLADEYQLVVNDNFQLFYRSVIRAVNPYGYYVKLEGTVGH